MPRKTKQPKQVKTLTHEEAKRKNIPTAEHQSVMADEEKSPIQVAYDRRNPDLDPQLIWRGKDIRDWSLVVSAPPLYIQEKVHPKVLIDDLMRRTEAQQKEVQLDLFATFDGLPQDATATEFYQHEANWSNRMILGDSLQVMASLAEREGLRGKVQCIYLDPPYGIKFNSNFQWSTTSRDVKDGKLDHITREPEQVKAFRDTWRDGIHSYLTYLRDRLMVARDLLTESGSIFVQIGDENVHRVRALMDEVFGDENHVAIIQFKKTGGFDSGSIPLICDYIVWFSKDKSCLKYRSLLETKIYGEGSGKRYKSVILENGEVLPSSKFISDNDELLLPENARLFLGSPLTSDGAPTKPFIFQFEGRALSHKLNQHWKTTQDGLLRLGKANRLFLTKSFINYRLFIDDFAATPLNNMWSDTMGTAERDKMYVVQTVSKVVERCILMTTDPGDLVLDPTCGSGTTAYVAEQWGRRWITIDTSRVALALARSRIMGARYPYYLLKDSPAGQQKEAELDRKIVSNAPTHENIRQGFVYERVPHITLKAIANNTEIDTIWEQHQPKILQALTDLNAALNSHKTPFKVTTGGREGKSIKFTDNGIVKLPSGEEVPANALLEWEIPREKPEDWPKETEKPLKSFWQARIARQKEIDGAIAANADREYLYDKPYEDKAIVRVAGPFSVESLSPHRVLAIDSDDELIDPNITPDRNPGETDFATIILDTLKVSGVQQAHKEDKIDFISLTGWAGNYICAEGRYLEEDNNSEKRAGIFIGPEFGTVSRPDLVAATREAGETGFDVLITCAFNYDAQSADFSKLGRIPVLKARMNADLHMADTLKNTGSGNLFVIFGEPDIDINEIENNQISIKIHGVDVFHPQSGEIRASNADAIACWFIDTDYNEESFFVRHAYFLGASDPYKSLKTTLKAEIDAEAWESLYSDISRPFHKPKSGRIAVKVINHLGDEVMKVFNVVDNLKS
ncbi:MULTISPECIES: site-specific DNA-methyltransferase [Spirulina sp. CCY15215]|uniref:site-specific DNA-methyltransferase n=1 Tax=Spirulina sp. CCY15215 TaxID=2767591 RepID=UPI00194EEC44|nr:site-specific DNA-methyltransferase [Spirulina major]